ncbi:uncharacterized protein FTOL_08078 [Fusarium torulosum]|uniref:Uncharacterized protein n=1 Tax=Fusarium torulosum TaxID=33205 RepID=A0AAE8SKD3_9HYPO|nr:uncharacterized protein FTOL_08078 [Fusarium torulosum]
MSLSEEDQTPTVAGRQQGQCPEARGREAALEYLALGIESQVREARDIAQQEVAASRSLERSVSTQLRRWRTGELPSRTPVPAIGQIRDRDIHGLPFNSISSPRIGGDSVLPRTTVLRLDLHERNDKPRKMTLQESGDRVDSMDLTFSSSPNGSVGSPVSSRTLSARDSPVPWERPDSPIPEEVDIGTVRIGTRRWPFHSDSSFDPSPPEEEYRNSESQSGIGSMTFWNRAYAHACLVTGREHESVRSSSATLVNVSPSPTEEYSSDSETIVAASNASSSTLTSTSLDDAEAETGVVRSVRVTQVGRATMIDMPPVNQNQAWEMEGVPMSSDALIDYLIETLRSPRRD